jgi:hypothetical protein
MHAACPRARLEALCACGPLGLVGGGDGAPLQLLAALLLGCVQRSGDRLRVESGPGTAIELQAVPETDWLAWEALCAVFDCQRPAPAAGHCRRLLCFCAGTGSIPEIRDSAPRCGWTRRWLRGSAEQLSAAARPRARPAGW